MTGLSATEKEATQCSLGWLQPGLVMGSNPASFPSHADDFGQVLHLPLPQGLMLFII